MSGESVSDGKAGQQRNTPHSSITVTGVGAVTGYGWGRKHTWDGFLLGESAVKLTHGFDGFVEGGSAYVSLVAPGGDRRDGPSKFMQAVRFAAREAVTDALERVGEPGPNRPA